MFYIPIRDLLYFRPFFFGQISGAVVRVIPVGSMIEITLKHIAELAVGKGGIIIFLNKFQSLHLTLVCAEVAVKRIHQIFLFRILYHPFYSVYGTDHVADRHVGIPEDHLSLSDGCFIYKFDTFGGGVYFILTDRKNYIKLQTSVPCFHVYARFRRGDPADIMLVQNVLYLIEVR